MTQTPARGSQEIPAAARGPVRPVTAAWVAALANALDRAAVTSPTLFSRLRPLENELVWAPRGCRGLGRAAAPDTFIRSLPLKSGRRCSRLAANNAPEG